MPPASPPRRLSAHFTIRAKLMLLVGMALGLVLLTASSGYWGMQRARVALIDVAETRMSAVMALQTLNEAKTALHAIEVSVFMYEADTEAQPRFTQLAAQNRDVWQRIDRNIETYQNLIRTEEEKAHWESALGDLSIWRQNDERLMDIVQRMASNHDPDEQVGLFQEYYLAYSVAAPLFLKAASSLNTALEASVVNAEAASRAASADSASASLLVVGTTAVAFGVLLVLGFVILRAVTRPIRTAIEAASRIAAGRLDVAIEIPGRDEMASMLESLASMQAQLRDIVGVIRSRADAIGDTCLQLSATTERISTATHRQVASTADMAGLIQQTAESMEYIASHATDARQMASEAGETSAAGEQVIKDVTDEMTTLSQAVIAIAGKIGKLDAHTREISTVVTVIREVAEQTNLLALNAAIEAARAGESGRGFAVVADEVRKLAERTSSSTKAIAETIHQIIVATEDVVADMQEQVDKVSRGAALARDAGTAVESINRETVRLIATVTDISATLDGQRQANVQVADAVEQIAQMSRTNGGSIHECAESASRLRDLSSDLRTAVDRFHLN